MKCSLYKIGECFTNVLAIHWSLMTRVWRRENINPERFDTADWLEGCDDAGDDKEEDEVCSRPKTANWVPRLESRPKQQHQAQNIKVS